MKKIHKYTSDQKLTWFGYGEWVEEPDVVEFTHNGLQCEIVRMAGQDPYLKEFHMYGGHLCGYVKIPKDHPYIDMKYGDMDIECHWGLTFGDDGWIGFDCAHMKDIIPSIELFENTIPELRELKEQYKNLFEQTSPLAKSYKNINFCIEECKSIADQLLKVKA